jgi:hypothetical protein
LLVNTALITTKLGSFRLFSRCNDFAEAVGGASIPGPAVPATVFAVGSRTDARFGSKFVFPVAMAMRGR